MRESNEHRHEGDARYELERDPTIMGNSAPRLRRLSQLEDYEIADGDPDIRQWRVFDAEGDAVGTVHDLIIDLGTLEARYVDLELAGDVAGSDSDQHVLVPIGAARLSDDVDAMTLTSLQASQLASLPRYDHSTITRDRECELQGALLGLGRPSDDTGAEFYSHPQFVATAFWGARRRASNQAYIVRGRSRP